MDCPSCNWENAAGKKFCGQCGRPLVERCRKCGAEGAPGTRYCSDCGTPFLDSTKARTDLGASGEFNAKIPGLTESLRGERRHLTILFCDVVGSTEIASKLDPEDWLGLVSVYQKAVTECVVRFGGSVARFVGDGILAFFGYPEAHEDDPERAVRAGLATIQSIETLNRQLQGAGSPHLSVRVGIDTGSVVVSTAQGRDPDAFGDTPNIAAKVQTAAEPNTLLITEAVNRLISGLFVVQDRGAYGLKGIEEPVHLYAVIHPNAVRQRLTAAAKRHGLSHFVGRDEELRILLTRWERVRQGNGQLVLITGDAGIGKSRLIQRAHELFDEEPHKWIECGGVPFFRNTPFFAVADMLEQGFAWRGDESPEERISQLEASLAMSGMRLTEAVPLVASLLNLPVSAKYPPLLLSSEEQHRRLLGTLVQWALDLARLQPAVVVMEDLHWVDSSTLEMVNLLAEKGAACPLLFLCSARSEFRIPWDIRAHHTQLILSPLTASEVRRMIAQVAAHEAFKPEVVDSLVTRTEGVPLFVEELVRSLLEGGVHSAVSEIPATLQDSLMARLDRLGGAKEVAEVGAVIGNEFSYELIRAVLPLTEAELQSHLRRLSDADLIYERGLPPDSTYSFKHALIRDAAYEALLRSNRRQLHQRVADVLETQHPNVAETQPEILALHYSSAGDASAAVAAWWRAGKRAMTRGAFREAEEYYNRAIMDLMKLPDTLDRARQEMSLRLGLGHVSLALNGYAAEETLRAYNAARALGDKLGNSSQLLFTLMGLFVSALTRAEKGLGQSLADELLRLATKDGGTFAIVWANLAQGMYRYFRGDLRAAKEYLSVAFSHCNSDQHQIVAQDPGLAALVHESLTSWHLGMADSARKQMEIALEMAATLKNNYETAMAEHFAAVLSAFLREPERCLVHVKALSAVVENQDFPFFSASSVVLKGWALAESGRYHEGAPMIRDGISQWIRNGMRVGLGFFLGLLAEAQCRNGEIEESLHTVEDALASTAEEELWQPYLLWVRGNLVLNKANPSPLQPVPGDRENAELWAQAEQNFRDSIAYAVRIGAKSLQLRAATSLGLILKGKGCGKEAGEILGPLYSSFTEGFDTRDLKEARSLLEDLGLRVESPEASKEPAGVPSRK